MDAFFFSFEGSDFDSRSGLSDRLGLFDLLIPRLISFDKSGVNLTYHRDRKSFNLSFMYQSVSYKFLVGLSNPFKFYHKPKVSTNDLNAFTKNSLFYFLNNQVGDFSTSIKAFFQSVDKLRMYTIKLINHLITSHLKSRVRTIVFNCVDVIL